MIITEYNVLNNVRRKLTEDKQDALEMVMSSPVESTAQITHFKAIYRYTETLLDELEEYAKRLNDPDYDEDSLKRFFGEVE